MENKILCKSCLNFIPVISWWCKEEKAVEFHRRRCNSIHGGCTECPFYIRIGFDYLKGGRWLFADIVRNHVMKKLKRREIKRINAICPPAINDIAELFTTMDYYVLRRLLPERRYRRKPKWTLRRWWNSLKRKYWKWRDEY